jgi:bifunctional UDP-N-acetylglucosamine pyrophosphorylase/glucosamine-1-phosphate N-acetyltransferase
MAQRTTLVVLAAGEGTRMTSGLPKVLHRIAEKPMIGPVVATARAAGADRIADVVGPCRDDVAAAALNTPNAVEIYVQK